MRIKRQKRRHRDYRAYFFLAPSFLGVLLFVLFPFLDVIRRSFSNAIGSQFVGFSNYTEIFHKASFLRAAGNTARFTVTAVLLLLLISLCLAVMLHSLQKKGSYFKTVFLLPMSVPVASVVILWRVFFAEAGLLNTVLTAFGMRKINFLQSGAAFWVLVFSYLWKNTGYNLVLWLAGLNGIEKCLYEAAALDGAGRIKSFFYITLPGLRSTFFVTAVLSIVNSFKAFREAYLVAGKYPHQSIYLLQHIFNNWFQKLEMQKMSAAAVILVLVITAVVLILNQLSCHKSGE